MKEFQLDVREKEILLKVIEVLEDGKALDPILLDLRALTTMTDYFLVAHGTNTRQVQALARSVDEALKESFGTKCHHMEGLSGGMWVLMDCGFFIVHLFLEEKREYYSLERIWMDAPRVKM